jgi:hypothetical protein
LCHLESLLSEFDLAGAGAGVVAAQPGCRKSSNFTRLLPKLIVMPSRSITNFPPLKKALPDATASAVCQPLAGF